MVLNDEKGTLKVELKGRLTLYIRYNNYGQYSYNVLFSPDKYDRIRFDNFDDRWSVSSKPHHCHPRYRKDGIDSNFTGDPAQDMPRLCELILSREVYQIL
jgi:hypothetical protein